MNVEDLMGLGLSRNESTVYLALASRGQASARTIIKDVGLHKKIVYDNLDRLLDKGLISVISAEHGKEFFLESAKALTDYIERQEELLAEQKKKAEKIAASIQALKKKNPLKQEASVSIGVPAVKRVLHSVLEESSVEKKYVAFGAGPESVEIMSEHFWKNFNLRQKEKNIHARLLFNSSLRAWGESVSKIANDMRYMDKLFEPRTQTIVYANSLAIIVWSEKPVATVIHDELAAKSYKDFFEILWKQAKE